MNSDQITVLCQIIIYNQFHHLCHHGHVQTMQDSMLVWEIRYFHHMVQTIILTHTQAIRRIRIHSTLLIHQ